jgi:hypothetical protein
MARRQNETLEKWHFFKILIYNNGGLTKGQVGEMAS